MSLPRLLIATNNQGKFHEYTQMLADLPIEIVSPRVLGINLAVEEAALTFYGNATLKAHAYGCASSLWTLADDSGLEVDALGGAPGVRSARLAGPDASDQANVALLLASLDGVPCPQRTARFRCAIALADACGPIILSEGTCEGYIALRPAGTHGFGYDPVFWLPDRSLTMAQLSPAEKNRLSHRAAALASIRPALLAILPTAP